MSDFIFPAGTPPDIEKHTNAFWELMDEYPRDDRKMAALVRKGICLEIFTQFQRIKEPLAEAAKNGCIETCRALILSGAKLNGNGGKIPLHEAYTDGRIDICRLLLAHGADIGATLPDGGRVFITYTSQVDEKLIRLLVKHGADVNARSDSAPAIIHLLYNNRLGGVKNLILFGANIYAKDDDGDSLLSIARPYFDRNTQKGRWAKPETIADDCAALAGTIKPCLEEYSKFQARHTPPETKEALYRILAAFPLRDPHADIDRPSQLRQIFAHAHWKKGQAHAIADALCEDGTVSAAFAEELAAIGEPRKTRSLSLNGGRGV